MERALYGPGGFYRRGERPSEHFRTSVHASGRFAWALARLLTEVDGALGRPARLDLVDVGAGTGRLLPGIAGCVPRELARRLVLTAVEIAPRPPGIPEPVRWRDEPPARITGMVIANEWLDNVQIDVVERTPDGPRTVLVDPATGAERAGPAPGPDDADWLERWWPLREPGDRAEIGRHRCAAWAGVVRRLGRGLAVAMDYSHTRAARPVYGTLTGYRDGATVPAVPDGSCDVTAHVALDACAVAGARRDRCAAAAGTRPDRPARVRVGVDVGGRGGGADRSGRAGRVRLARADRGHSRPGRPVRARAAAADVHPEVVQTSTCRAWRPRRTKPGFHRGSSARRMPGASRSSARYDSASSMRASGAPRQ
jgi:hypothetical protein